LPETWGAFKMQRQRYVRLLNDNGFRPSDCGTFYDVVAGMHNGKPMYSIYRSNSHRVIAKMTEYNMKECGMHPCKDKKELFALCMKLGISMK